MAEEWDFVQGGATPGGLTGPQSGGATTLQVRNRFLKNELLNSSFGLWSGGTDSLYGSNLVTNGAFTSDTSSWAATNGTIASVAGGESGNCLEITRTSGTQQYVTQTISGLVVGKRYKLTVYVKSGTSGNEAFYAQAIELSNGYVSGTSSGSWVAHTDFFVATATSFVLYVVKNTATAGTMLFDTIKVEEYVLDGSVGIADFWSRDAWATVTRMCLDSTYTKTGSAYALKVYQVTSVSYSVSYVGNLWSDTERIRRFAGRTVSFGCWIWCSAGTTKLAMGDGSTITNSAAHPGNSTWKWMEFSRTFGASPTAILFGLSVANLATAYFSQPFVGITDYIGADNTPGTLPERVYPGNIINLYSGKTITTALDVYLVGLTGKLPLYVSSIQFRLRAQSDTAGTYLRIMPYQGGTTAVEGIRLDFPVANQDISIIGDIPTLNDYSKFYISPSGGTITFTLDIITITQ